MRRVVILGPRPHMEVVYRLCTIPGVYRHTASTLIAELGVDMAQFPDADHLASWAGLCPGACQSGGKRKSAKTRNGNPHVRRALCEAAWAATRSKRSYLRALFHRITARAGRKKALVAVARRLIIIAYHVIRGTHGYRELGPSLWVPSRLQRIRIDMRPPSSDSECQQNVVQLGQYSLRPVLSPSATSIRETPRPA